MPVNSNASNFASFVQNNVDPRTGQYTLAVELPELVGNNLCGPSLSLRLSFNPMNEQDAGFGVGWSLNLSRFVISSGMLELAAGESFKVVDNGPGQEPLIAERKLESFHLHNESDAASGLVRYRVVHKSGQVEVLQPQEGDPKLALPVRMLTPAGHGLTLAYRRKGALSNLESVSDDTGRQLVRINYASNNEVLIDVHPDDPAVKASYILRRQGDHLSQLVLPTDEQASWRFEYETLEGMPCVKRVENPMGGVEDIFYDPIRHRFPPDAAGRIRLLPRVRQHIVQPLAGQPEMVTRYSYTDENFLGFNGRGIVWSDDGLDNLYKLASSSYTYGSTAHYLRAGQPGEPAQVMVRSIRREFNRFHLLTKQVTLQQDCEETTTAVFHEVENLAFKDQPSTLQLPKTVTKEWRFRPDPTKYRREQVTTHYDPFGNLLEETLANGVRRIYTYYPAKPEPGSGCPADPEGFVRNVESMTVYPAEVTRRPGEAENADDEQAKVARVRYNYHHLPALPPLDPKERIQPGWLEPVVEQLFVVQADAAGQEQESLQHRTERNHFNDIHNRLLHGRIKEQTSALVTDATQDAWRNPTAHDVWHYRVMNDDAEKPQPTRLATTQTQTVPGGTLQRRLEHIQHIHTTGLYQSKDFNGVISRFRYDRLNRLVEETVAPDDPQVKASRTYAYGVVYGDPRSRAFSDETDVSGVRTRTYLDGASRVLSRRRYTSDGEEQRIHYEARYDSLGNQSGETFFDYLEDENPRTLTLDYSFSYDGWGQLRTVLRPDGISEHRLFSPFGPEGNQVTSWITTLQAPDQRLQEEFSEFNLFDKPIYEVRRDGQREVGRQDYRYDGLGQCIAQTLSMEEPALARPARPHRPLPRAASGVVRRTTRMRYDIWGRMHETQRPDDSLLQRQFSPNSTSELTTLFQVKKAGQPAKTICTREFDELERLSRVEVGPRVRTFSYKPDTELMEQTTGFSMSGGVPGPDKRSLTYTYEPNHTDQPVSIKAQRTRKAKTLANSSSDFAYDTKTANITSATNVEGSRTYAYTDLGLLKQESWQDPIAGGYTIDYRYSAQGLLLQREDSIGQPIEYRYDDQGRMIETRQGSLQATLAYNSAGLLHSTDTRDEDGNRHLRCEMFYDTLGREVKRTLSVDAGVPHELHLVWRDDDLLLQRRLMRGGNELLTEHFDYDALDRLAFHDSFGPNLPCNEAGRAIISQQFDFDEQDNLTGCRTWFEDGKEDHADFIYKDDGSFQLDAVTHTLTSDYRKHQAFSYDEMGNALNDELGRRLLYDDIGRLVEVRSEDDSQQLANYRYDSHDQLFAERHGGAPEVLRRYQGLKIDSTLQDGLLTQYLYSGDTALGLNEWEGDESAGRLLLNDAKGSVIGEYDKQGLRPSQDGELRPASYSAYGERPRDNGLRTLLAFNGELREETFGWYLLGRGYRAYNPSLMRFHSPDTLDPEQSGINPYLFCLGNPSNWEDPSGHRSAYGYGKENPTDRSPHPPYLDPPKKRKKTWVDWIGVGISVLFLVASIAGVWHGFAMGLGFIIASVGIGLQMAAIGVGIAANLSDDPETAHMLNGVASLLTAVGSIAVMMGMSLMSSAKLAKAGKDAATAAKGTQKFTSSPSQSQSATPRPSVTPSTTSGGDAVGSLSRTSSIRSSLSGAASRRGSTASIGRAGGESGGRTMVVEAQVHAARGCQKFCVRA